MKPVDISLSEADADSVFDRLQGCKGAPRITFLIEGIVESFEQKRLEPFSFESFESHIRVYPLKVTATESLIKMCDENDRLRAENAALKQQVYKATTAGWETVAALERQLREALETIGKAYRG